MAIEMNRKVLAELLAASSIVGSLIFVGLQLRLSYQVGANEISLMHMQSKAEANAQINQYADIWVAGIAGEELSRADAVVFENLVLNLNELAFFVSSTQYTPCYSRLRCFLASKPGRAESLGTSGATFGSVTCSDQFG